MKNCSHKVAIVSCMFLLGLSACVRPDDLQMRNPDTGDEITCESGGYWFEQEVPDSEIASQCVQACARYGYKLMTNEGVSLDTPPHAPDEDVKEFIPSQCLSDSEK